MAQPPSSNHQQGTASSTLHQVRSCLCLHSDPKVSIQLPARALESFATCFITRCEFRCVAPPLIVANACFVGHTHTDTDSDNVVCVWGMALPMAFINLPVPSPLHFPPLRSPPQFGINFRWAHPPRGLGPPPLALINTCLLSRCSGVRSTPITNCKLMLSKRGKRRRGKASQLK